MAPRDFATRLSRRATRSGLALTDELIDKLSAFYDLLSRWNQKINLTSLADPDEAIDRLLLEPLVAARHVPGGASNMLDVGSGGGSPAIPLKLAVPRLELTMVEAKARKSAFLREAIRQLDLANAHVETARVEELLPRPPLHEAFDLVTVRAVRIETKALHTLQAFVAPGGRILMFRGPLGPAEPGVLVPPLEWKETLPLVDSLRSRLTILAKRPIGGANVPRGTMPKA